MGTRIQTMLAKRTIDEASLVSAVGKGAILWGARRQTCVATSTTEAELHDLSEAVKEVVHLRGILDTLGESIATTVFTDSQSWLALATRDNNSANAKQFATRMAYVRATE